MSDRPSFQFYPGDWLAASEIAEMSAAQEGAYIRLLCYCWRDDDCSLPDDSKRLAILGRVDEGLLDLVQRCFIQHPTKAGRLTHPRLMKERTKQDEWREKCAKGGRKSAETRKKKGLKGSSKVVASKSQGKGNTSSSSSSSSSSSYNNKHKYIGSNDSYNEHVPEQPPTTRPDSWQLIDHYSDLSERTTGIKPVVHYGGSWEKTALQVLERVSLDKAKLGLERYFALDERQLKEKCYPFPWFANRLQQLLATSKSGNVPIEATVSDEELFSAEGTPFFRAD